MKPEMLCFLVLLTASTGSAVARTGLGTEMTNFSHKVITHNTLSTSEHVGSAVTCVMLCLEVQTCVSVFYRKVSRRCQLHDVLYLSPQDGEEENGTKYYSLTAGTCPTGYIHARMLGLCYQLHLNMKPRDEAVTDCASRGEHLIVIDSQEKQDHVRKQVTSSSGAMLKNYYIDGSDMEAEGQWLYHDGRPMTFFAWEKGNPNNKTQGRDFMVASWKDGTFLWVDSGKNMGRFYFCQKDI